MFGWFPDAPIAVYQVSKYLLCLSAVKSVVTALKTTLYSCQRHVSSNTDATYFLIWAVENVPEY